MNQLVQQQQEFANNISQNYIGSNNKECIDGGSAASNQHDTSTLKLIPRHLFHPDNKIS
jgi:hypothetical protein